MYSKNVKSLMVKLKTSLLSTHPVKLIRFKACTCNETRWNSSFKMLSRYKTFRDNLHFLSSPRVHELKLNTSKNCHLNTFHEQLENLDDVYKRLQSDSTIVTAFSAQSNTVMQDFPGNIDRLLIGAAIIYKPNF